jgi:ATP-binding cassette subfamily B protein
MLRDRLRALLQDSNGALAITWRLFAENGREHLRSYVLALALMTLGAAATAASAWLMRDVVNAIFVERRAELVAPVALSVMAVFLVKGLATYGETLVLSRVGARIVARVQARIADAVLAQGVAFYDDSVTAQITARMSHNAGAARDLINSLATAAGRDLLSVIALVGVMIAQDPVMAFLALVVAPPAVIGVLALVRKVKKLAKREFLSLARIIEVMNEAIRGVRVVKGFTMEPRIRADIRAAIETVERRAIRVARLNAMSTPLMETLGGVAVGLVILYAGHSVIGRGGDPGGFFAFMAAFLMAYEPAKRLAKLNVQLQARIVGVRMLYELLDLPPTIVDAPDARRLVVTEGRVRFDAVDFAYRDRPALRALTLEAAPGAVTALVGPSGAGKSTVFALLERFYDADRGRITIDGQEVRAVTLVSLRRAIAMVSQDTFLFSGTIRENIRVGRPEADDAAVEDAARAANVWAFAEAMPDGLDTAVGEGGGRLSGGQRQRVAIARAMLRDAPILLLDEATSALDAEAEAAVQDAIGKLMAGRTTLVIAHRLSTIRSADMIHVMEGGRVVESGPHEALVRRDGLYRRLSALQFTADAAPTVT